MPTVPVYVPSYDQSGETHVVNVGGRFVWELAVMDTFLPDHLLDTVDAVTEPAGEPFAPADYFPVLIRVGTLTAWWDPGRPVSGTIKLHTGFSIGDSRLPPEGIPTTEGIVVGLYRAVDLLRQRPAGPWDAVPGIGLAEVSSTRVDPDQGFTAYFPAKGVDTTDGQWRHIGWIAMLQCD